MAWTQSDIDTLKAARLALAKGERIVRCQFSDRLVEYQQGDDAQMRALQVEMETVVNSGTRPSYRVAGTSKGV
jgi:hypothetical protein